MNTSYRPFLNRQLLPRRGRHWLAAAALFALLLGGCTEDTDPDPGEGTSDTSLDDAGGGDASTGTDGSEDVAMPDDTEEDVGGPMPGADQEAILSVNETESWTLPNLSGPAYVVRTEANIPHIYAENRDDLARVVGFTLARDRFFVMDLQRRLGRGTITELLGDAALENDLEARQSGIAFVGERLEQNLDDDLRSYLTAFTEGVNAYADAVKNGDLPPPSELQLAYVLVGAESPSALMQPFELADVTAMAAVVMYETNFETGDVGRTASLQNVATIYEEATGAELELRKTGFLGDIWNNHRPIFPGSGSSPGFGTTGASKPGAAPVSGATFRPVPMDMLERLHTRLERFSKKINRNQVAGFGSNAWAVAADKSNAGTLVAGDGHLQLSVPSLMYQIGMDTQVFGGGNTHQLGLFLTPLPITGAGTNGKVAWSMVNPVVDITDWYREELQLDTDGQPIATRFGGEDTWEPLTSVDETYEIAEVLALGSVGRTETWRRFVTFDGRWIMEIEGNEVDSVDDAEEGQYVVNLGGKLIVPADTDDDGVITAISFDFGAFDATQWTAALSDLGFADDLDEYREATKKLVGGGLFMAAGDNQGNILYSSYQAIPCRGYLEKTDGVWEAGSNPAYLLDGTTYGAFSMPTASDGKIDEGPGATDPYQCVVPFDAMPQSINPESGYVVTANNDPADITDDGNIFNDEYYLGGPWSSVRANTISRELADGLSDGPATVQLMSTIQGSKISRLGEEFAPFLSAAINLGAEASGTEGEQAAWRERLATTYEAHTDDFAKVNQYMVQWMGLDAEAISGVETFYAEAPQEGERDAAVATMIFNAWFPRFINLVWNDEPVGGAFPFSSSRMKVGALRRFLAGRGENNPGDLASWNEATGESIFFDVLGTDDVERAEELALTALVQTLEFLKSEPTGPGEGGFGTDDMSQWLWGLRHQARFESLLGSFLGADSGFGQLADAFSITTDTLPLAENLSSDDPRKDLKWFPRGGDNWGVDAANPGFSGTRFTHGNGPVMRMVISLEADHVGGVNIVPGGQSGLNDSPFFADQARKWLANETLPMRFHVVDVVEGATGRETFRPPAETPSE